MARPKAFNEEEVLEKSMTLFWQKGYNATTIQDLVDATGINKPSIYNTYGDKENIFLKALDFYKVKSLAGFKNKLSDDKSVYESVRKLLNDIISDGHMDKSRKGCFYVNTILELIPGNEEIEKSLQSHKVNLESLFQSYFKNAIATKDLNSNLDPKELSKWLFGLIMGYRVTSKLENGPNILAKTVDLNLTILK